jgi:peptide/nickel transport system permease protein
LLGELLSQDRRPVVRAVRQKASRPAEDGGEAVVDVRGLRVSFRADDGSLVERVHGIDLTIGAGEVVGVVGESGSGKSVTAMAIAGLLGPQALLECERLTFRGIDMGGKLSAAQRRQLGLEQAMIFQDPLSSLNPALTIGRQLTEVSQVHAGLSRSDAIEKAVRALDLVRIPEAARRVRQLPHEFSGGMRQRAMIAMGLMGSPRLLIADEPTTALDVTVQRQVLRALRDARERTGAAILLISHDIALVSGFCDRVVVMRDGVVVEQLAVSDLDRAEHPYTRGLIACVPGMTTDRSRPLPVIGVAADEEVPV